MEKSVEKSNEAGRGDDENHKNTKEWKKEIVNFLRVSCV